MTNESTEDKTSNEASGQNEPVVMCKWYAPCSYGKWETTHEAETRKGWPLLIQKKHCIVCGKVRIRKASCFD